MSNTTRRKTAEDYLRERAERMKKNDNQTTGGGTKQVAPGSKKLVSAADNVKRNTAEDYMADYRRRKSAAQQSSDSIRRLAEQAAAEEMRAEAAKARVTDREGGGIVSRPYQTNEALKRMNRGVTAIEKDLGPEKYGQYLLDRAAQVTAEAEELTRTKGQTPLKALLSSTPDRPTTVDTKTGALPMINRNFAEMISGEQEKVEPYSATPDRETYAQTRADTLREFADEYKAQYAERATKMPDFEKVAAQEGPDTKVKHTAEEAEKLRQERLNRQAVGGGGILNPSADNEQELIDQWITDKEVKTYNYLVNTGMKDIADVYWEKVMAEAQNRRIGKVQTFVGTAPDGFLEDALGSALSIGYNLSNQAAGGGYVLDQGIRSALGDEEANINPYHPAFYSGAVRDTLREDVMKDMGEVGRFIYQSGMSMGDTLAGAAVYGSALAPVMMGSGAMADTAKNAKISGATDEQALALGIVAGAAELVSEKIGFDQLGKLIGGVKGNVFRAVLGHMASEFGEESATEAANLLADYLIMQDKSEYEKLVAQYGGGEEGARRAWGDMLGQIGLSGLGGALSGAVMGGGSAVIGKVYQEMQLRRGGRAMDKALAQMAAQNEGTQNEDAVKAPADVSELALQTADNLIAEEKAAAQGGAQEATQQPAQLPRAADQTADQTAETQTADRPQVVPERTGSQPVQSAAANALGDEQKQRFMTAAEKYGDKALVFAHNYEGGDVQTYDKAFNALYTAGRVGLTLDRVGSVTDALTAGLSDTAKRAIWQAGQNSVMTEVRPGVQKMYTVRATNLQKRQIAMLNEIGRKYGVEIDIVDSIRVGDRQMANGAYSGGRKIVVALDAAEGAILQAGVHELTHYLKRTDADAYEVLKNVVMEHLQKSDTFILEDAISARRAQYAGQNLTDEAIIEEIVAEAVPTFLTDEKAVRAFVSENRPLAQKIRDFFVKFAEEIREIAKKYMKRDGAARYEIENLLGRSDALTEIARTFDAALESAETIKDAGAGETVYAKGESTGEIREGDIAVLRTVGRKSVSAFNSQEIQNAEKWARKFWMELGIKSPFFRAWFGEWRAVDNNAYIDVADIPEYVDANEARKNNRGNVVNMDTGWDVRISREGETNTISHSGSDKKSEYGLAGIRALIQNALLLDSEVHIPHSNSVKNDTVTFDHKLYALGKDERGQVALYKITVEEFFQSTKQPGEKKFHNLKYIEKIADNIGGRTYENSRSGGSTSDVSTTDFSVAQLYAFVKRYDKDFTPAPQSSAVMKNGKPLVVYHQTAGDFTVFNTNNPVAGLNDSETPNGMFFKTNDHDIGIGGDKQMAVYLRMENPLHFTNRKEANAWYRKHVDGYAELAEEYDAAAEKFNADADRVNYEIFETDDEDRIQELEAEEDRLLEEFKPVEDDYRGRLRKLLDDYFLSGKSKYDGIELDYDGHRWVNGVRENVHTFIAFYPTQIKSATDNVGTFNPDNPDIRLSLTPTETRRAESGEPVSGVTEAQFSLARNEEFMDDARTVNAKTGNVDAAVMEEAAEERAKVKAYMEEHGEVMHLPADIEGNTFFADGAYGGSEESTSVCIRSMAAQELMDLIAKDLGRPLTVEDTLVISQDIAGYTDKPECYYCYVAQDRRAIREFLGTYMQQRDDVLKRYRAGEDRNQVYQDWLDGRKDTKNMRDRFAMWTKAVDEGDALIEPKDLASMEDLNAEITTLQTRIAEAIGGRVQFAGLGYKQDGGRTKSFASVLKTADAELAADINRYIQLADALQYAKSASWAKKQTGYAAYNGHILKWSADKIKGFNDHYGLRMYSFSDFSPAFILENMQMITDAAVKGLKVLAYTKEMDFARIFAPTGANINISVFAQEINGQITSDGMMGADWAEAIKLRGQYPNVGITFVATSDSLAAFAEKQDWIDTVIPYHLVRTGTKVANYFGYKNYTAESSDRKKPGIKFKKGDVTSIPPEMHGNDIVKYVEALEKHNLTPRFENRMVGYREFLAGEMSEDEFRAANPYYMKYVNETRRSAQETPVVQPRFNGSAAVTAMETMIREGGYGAPIGQSYEVMQEIAEEIADKIRAGSQTQTMFSLNNTSPATSITDENQNLNLPVDVQVDRNGIRKLALEAVEAGFDSGLDERMQARIRGIANKIMKETGSGYSKADFIQNVTKLVEEYAKNGWTEDTLRAVTEMSKKIIETSSQADNSLREQYADVRKRLRESGVALTETQKQEAANLSGGYGEYRKSVFGTVNLKDEGMTLESLWGELSEQHPEIFTPGAVEGDQVRILQEFAYLMRPKYENPYGMDMDGAALEMAMRIEGDVMAMIGARDAAKSMYGSAEKLRSRFEAEYREKLKQRKAERVQKFQQIAADLKAAKAKGDSAEQAKVMGRYRAAMKATGLDEAYAEIRATLKAREEQKAENAKTREMRGKVTRQASELMNMLAKPKKGRRIPTQLQGLVLEALEALEALDLNGTKAEAEGRQTQKAAAFREKLAGIRKFYEDVMNSQSRGEAPEGLDGLMMTISERNLSDMQEALEALGSGDRFHLRDMNSDQLRSLESLLKNIRHTVESVGKLWRIQRYQGVAELGDASIEEMSERGPQKISETSAAGKGRDFLALDMLEPVSYGERLGEGGGAIIQGLMDGEKEKFSKVREAAAATMKMMKDAGVSGYDIGKWKTNVQTVEFGNGAKVRMTDAMIMSLYLTAQRPQGRQHLLGNGLRIPTTKETGAQVRHVPLSDNDLQMIAEKLNDKQRKMADAMQAYLSTDVAKWGNDVTQRLYLYDAFTEDKYWPLTSDPNVLKTQEPEGDRAFSAILNAGFTKPLNEKANNPVIITDAFDVFGRHIGEMASYAGYAEVMTDTMAWINYRQRTEDGLIGGTVKESIESLLGSGGVKYLTKLVQDINGARRGGDGTQLNKLLTNYKKAAVMGKIRVWIQQPMSIVRAAAEINPMYLLTGLKAGKGAVAEMQKHSSLAWWKANGNFEIGIGKGTDAVLWGDTAITDTVIEKAATLGGLIDPGKADDWAWARIWSAVKREVKRTRRDLTVGSDEYFAEVTRRFEAICDRTQVVDTVMHRSDMMRSKDGLIRSLTSFMSEPTKSYNMLMRSIMEAGRNPKDKAARMKLVRSGWVYVASAAATAAATALFDALKYRDDDDPIWDYYLRGGFLTDWTERLLKNFLSGVNPLENIPIVSDAYAALFKGEEATMMEFQAMKDFYDAFENGKDYFFGGNEKKLTFYGAVSPAVKVASELTGLPVSGLMANAEMLVHAFDPKLLQTKSDMQTMGEAYDKLYKAMAEGNRKEELAIRTELAKGLYGNTPKNPKEIDTGVAEALAWNDERILKAWQLKQKGQINDLNALYKMIQKDGFTDEVVKKAANRVEGLMNTKYREALEEGKTAEAEAIRAKAAKYGMVLTQKEPKDMDEELEAKTIEYKQLFEAIRSGDDEDIAAAAEIMEAESDAVNPAQAVRGQVSGEFKQEYVDMVRSGRTKEAEELGRKLDLFDLDEEDRLKWVKDDYREDLKQAVRDGDAGTADEIIETLKDEYGLDDESLAQSLTSEFKQEYIDLVMAGKDREADALAEKLQDLGLKYADGNNRFKQANLNKWVRDWEKAQEEDE